MKENEKANLLIKHKGFDRAIDFCNLIINLKGKIRAVNIHYWKRVIKEIENKKHENHL